MRNFQKFVSAKHRGLRSNAGPSFAIEPLESRQLLSATGFNLVDQNAFPAAPTAVATLPTIFKDDISQAWPTLVNGQLKIQGETLQQEVASAIQAAAQSGQGISASNIASSFNTNGNYSFAIKSTSSSGTVVQISYDATGNSTTFTGKINNVNQNFKVTYDLTLSIDLTLPSNLVTGKVTATATAAVTNLHVTTNNLTGTVLNDFAANVAKNVGNGVSNTPADLSALAPISVLTTELHAQSAAGYTHLHTAINASGNLELTAQSPTLTVTGAANSTVTISAGTNGSVVVSTGGATETFDGGFLKTINVDTVSGHNTINIPSLPAGINVHVNGTVLNSTETETVTVGGTGSLASVAGTVSVSNTSGKTSLVVNDGADAGQSNLTVTNNAVKFQSRTVVTYGSGVSSLAVDSGAFGANITVLSTASGVPTSVNTDKGTDNVSIDGSSSAVSVTSLDGNDNVTVGNGSLSAIGGPISVSNTSGKTAVNIDDSHDLQGRFINLTSSAITFQGLTTISLANNTNITGVTFNDGSAGNAINAQSSPRFGYFTVFTDGSDFIFGPAAGQVEVF